MGMVFPFESSKIFLKILKIGFQQQYQRCIIHSQNETFTARAFVFLLQVIQAFENLFDNDSFVFETQSFIDSFEDT